MDYKKCIFVTYEKYLDEVNAIEKKIRKKYDNTIPYEYIIAILRGGVVMGIEFSYRFNIPLIVINPESSATSWPMLPPLCKMLVVDDATDSGKTLSKICKELKRRSVYFDTAVTYLRPWTKFKPTFYSKNPTKGIVMPWEPLRSPEKSLPTKVLDNIKVVYNPEDSEQRENIKMSYYLKDIFDSFNHYVDEDDMLANVEKLEQDSDITSKEFKDNMWKLLWDHILREYGSNSKKLTCFYLYFYERLTQKEIGEILGVTQEYVNRVLKVMSKELSEHFNPEETISNEV